VHANPSAEKETYAERETSSVSAKAIDVVLKASDVVRERASGVAKAICAWIWTWTWTWNVSEKNQIGNASDYHRREAFPGSSR
jgi:hypothetical protein